MIGLSATSSTSIAVSPVSGACSWGSEQTARWHFRPPARAPLAWDCSRSQGGLLLPFRERRRRRLPSGRVRRHLESDAQSPARRAVPLQRRSAAPGHLVPGVLGCPGWEIPGCGRSWAGRGRPHLGPLLLCGAQAAGVTQEPHPPREASRRSRSEPLPLTCGDAARRFLPRNPPAQCVSALRGGHRASVVAVAFSPSGRRLLSAGAEREASLRLWDWRAGTALASAAAPAPVCSIAFADDDSWFSTAGPSSPVRLWHVRSAAKGGAGMQIDLRPPPAGAAAGEKGSAGVAGRGGAIVCLSGAGRLSLLRPGRGFERWTDALAGAASAPAAVAVSPLHVAAGGAKGVVRLFDPATLAFTGALPRPAARGRLDVNSAEEARQLAADTSAEPFPDVVALRCARRRKQPSFTTQLALWTQ